MARSRISRSALPGSAHQSGMRHSLPLFRRRLRRAGQKTTIKLGNRQATTSQQMWGEQNQSADFPDAVVPNDGNERRNRRVRSFGKSSGHACWSARQHNQRQQHTADHDDRESFIWYCVAQPILAVHASQLPHSAQSLVPCTSMVGGRRL